MAVDLHSHAVESAFAIPVEHVSAVSLLAEAARPSIGERAVVISPDLGAVKMAERYAKLLDLPVAVIHKSRISGQNVRVERILGEVCDKEVLVIDDMISTGETIEKAIKSLLEAGCVPSRLKVSATHGLFVGPAAERLGALGIERIFVSDSVPAPETFPAPLQIVSIGPLLAHAIERLHRRESLGDLTARE
jgi:ribose-phosphate pyrophosphokinase